VFRTIAVVTATIMIAAAHPTAAQPYPSKPIRLIVPQSPGGPTDILARLTAQRLTTVLGQSAVPENRGGAGGAIAAKTVAGAEPDGHTLLFANTSVLILVPALSRSAGYDAGHFAPVARVAESYQVLVVHPSVPAGSVRELVAYARANPGKLNYSSAGVGNTIHLAGELFNTSAGIKMVHVPYNSGAEATTAALGGQVQVTFVNITGVADLIASGKLRALAVTSPTRMAALPNVPTMVESGFPDIVIRAFFGVVAPAGTPPAIVSKLNAAVDGGLTTGEMKAALARLGAEPTPGSGAEFAAFIAAERNRWEGVAQTAGIRLD
jgi:tripartite-type tricarboxylate transporter receptor subunit TctC